MRTAVFFTVTSMLVYGGLAPAQPAVAKPAGGGFKPMVVNGSQTAPSAAPALPPGQTPFPKMQTPYPNVGAYTGQPQILLNNVQQIPPQQMQTNQNLGLPINPLALFPGLGGNSAPGSSSAIPNGGSGLNGSDTTLRYPRSSSNDGDVFARDRSAFSGVGKNCRQPVNPDYERAFANVPIATSISKIAGARCDDHPTDRVVCMACNLYFEVDPKDSYEGHVAVARSVMTRAVSSGYPSDVCKVVYQHTARVAQYSWTFESPKWNPDHILPGADDPRLQRVFRASVEGLQKGPNGFTNYYAQNLVNPSWARSGTCAASLCTIEHHTFCAINANQDRSPAMYLKAERIDAKAASSPAGGAEDSSSTANQ